ncbi:membrane protein FxsA (plasmid) [Morganella morganii]|uniref:Membrane protein FxsA n=1 Tax=Morganella morganii TaxID=582 RepID=A0A433ZQV9_MORMO|nr:FxsA family protein [Morganella morganii]RUT64486.1 membrane protein FxsA [Morganella morganii]
MRWLPLILICLLIYIEAVIFVHVASAIGVFMTLVLVVLTSCLGVSLVRNQGMRNLGLIQQKIQAGESPAAEMIKSVSLVLAGILLVLPGFFTDFLGLLLLLPPVQKLLVSRVLPFIRVYQPRKNPFSGTSANQGNVYEGEFERRGDTSSQRLNQSPASRNDDNRQDKP